MDLDFLTVLQIKKGNTQAGEKLIRKYYPEILRYCFLHLSDRTYAEDMTQETFVRFFTSLERYQPRGQVKNYLYTIAANLCRDYYKKIRELPVEELPEQLTEPIPRAEEKLDVSAALGRLPMELQQVVILYFFRDFSQKEIAGILKISPTLVRRRLERAKEQLRVFLEEEEK